MADLVEGMTLRASAGWPVLRLDLPSAGSGAQRRVYVLPGIPQLLRSKVEALVELEGELPTGDRWTLETLELSGDESRISARLRALAAEHPEVEIGSYPRWEHDEQGRLRTLVRLTFESRQAELAQAARDAVAKALDIALPATTC